MKDHEGAYIGRVEEERAKLRGYRLDEPCFLPYYVHFGRDPAPGHRTGLHWVVSSVVDHTTESCMMQPYADKRQEVRGSKWSHPEDLFWVTRQSGRVTSFVGTALRTRDKYGNLL